MKRLPRSLWLLALIGALDLSSPAVPAEVAPDPASRAIEAGARGKVLTVIEGRSVEEIPLTFLGTYRDFAGPGYDLHLVRLEGEVADRVGVAAGMSGSPVYVGDRLIGALAYRLGALPKSPVAGVTPIEDILETAAERPGGVRSPAGTTVTPIATPVLVSGLAPAVRDWLAPQLEPRGFLLVAGGSGGAFPETQAQLAPGSPLGVELARGDARIAATGTVTWVDGDVVYAFGHPFLGTGRAEMPMVSAEVIHTLADLAGSLKLANVGPEVGAILEDRQSSVVGKLGRRARMIPIRMTLRGGDYGEREYGFEVVHVSDLAPLLTAVVVANSLVTSNGYTAESTMFARATVRLKGHADVRLETALSGARGTDPAIALATTLFATMARLWTNPFGEVEVESIELAVETVPELVGYRVESVHYDRGSLAPGQTLEVRCVLREYRGGTVTRDFSLRLPERLPRPASLVLAVSNPDGIDRFLGRPLEQRLQSAKDLGALIEALGDQRSAHRLTAVVYEAGGAVVSRGTAYSELPPTAEHLLTLQADGGSGKRRLVSPVSRAELELDGPVAGGVQVRLRVDRGVRGAEDR